MYSCAVGEVDMQSYSCTVGEVDRQLYSWRVVATIFYISDNVKELLKAGKEAARIFPADDHIHYTVGNSLGIVGKLKVC